MEEISFEEAFRRLEAIVATLESGRGELEESLAKYEEGVRLLRRCRQILDGAERRVEILKGLDDSGAPILEKADENALRSQTDVAGRQTPPANAPKKNATPQPAPGAPSNFSPPLPPAPSTPPQTPVPPPTSGPRRAVRRTSAPPDAPPAAEKTPTKRSEPPRSRSFFDDEPPF